MDFVTMNPGLSPWTGISQTFGLVTVATRRTLSQLVVPWAEALYLQLSLRDIMRLACLPAIPSQLALRQPGAIESNRQIRGFRIDDVRERPN